MNQQVEAESTQGSRIKVSKIKAPAQVNKIKVCDSIVVMRFLKVSWNVFLPHSNRNNHRIMSVNILYYCFDVGDNQRAELDTSVCHEANLWPDGGAAGHRISLSHPQTNQEGVIFQCLSVGSALIVSSVVWTEMRAVITHNALWLVVSRCCFLWTDGLAAVACQLCSSRCCWWFWWRWWVCCCCSHWSCADVIGCIQMEVGALRAGLLRRPWTHQH